MKKQPIRHLGLSEATRIIELQNDLDAARKHMEIDQRTIEQLNARLRELVSENEQLIRERDHMRRVWVVLEQLSGR